MAEFKFVISEPETKKSYQKAVDQGQAAGVIGKKIGDEVSGDILGLASYSLQITGGTDKDGFPMHPSVRGSVKKRVLLSGPPGFYPKIKGQRKRKFVRGDTISQDIVQINAKVIKKGEKSLEELLPQKPKEKKTEEKKVEEKKEEKKEEKVEQKPAAKEENPKTEEPKKAEEKKEEGEGEKTNEKN